MRVQHPGSRWMDGGSCPTRKIGRDLSTVEAERRGLGQEGQG